MGQNIIVHTCDFNILLQDKKIKQLKSVSIALNILQTDSKTIEDACHTWCNLQKDDNLKPHFSKVNKKFEQVILH